MRWRREDDGWLKVRERNGGIERRAEGECGGGMGGGGGGGGW